MAYDRSNTAFFHDNETKDAIVKLASFDRLVIYCGAGVTIDRTGLGWGDLVAQLSETSDKRQPAGEPTTQEVETLRKEFTPLQLASVLAERTFARHHSEDAARKSLVPKLQQALYEDSGWQSGALVSNIIRLAFGFVQLGKQVTIVTSNYDTYLEDEYLTYRKAVQKNRPHAEIPGITARAATGTKQLFKNQRAKGGIGKVEIIYLHGRIPRAGNLGGRLALSENDYHEIADPVVSILESLFTQTRTGVLVLGASLTDPPLLRALSRTRQSISRPGIRHNPNRIALVPASSTGFAPYGEDFSSLIQHLTARTLHFDVELLIPDFHFQIAQFCQEILTAVSLGKNPGEYLAEQTAARYGRRLRHWWEQWKARDEQLGPERTFQALNQKLDSIKKSFASAHRVKDPSGESLKIEFWVRNNPDDKNRRLTLWGSSAGILKDPMPLSVS